MIPPMRFLVLCLASLIFLVNAFVKTQAEFGIDVERYEVVLQSGIADWSPYYLKEFVSWGMLDAVSNFSPMLTTSWQLILLDVIVLVIVSVACRHSGFIADRLPFLYLTFAFVLLSFNVLRQYIAFGFLVGAAISAINKWPLRFAVYVGLAIFSHNGSILVIPALGLLFMRDLPSFYRVMLAIVGLSILALMSTSDSVLQVFEAGGDALEEPFWKVMLYAVLSLYLAFFTRLEYVAVKRLDAKRLSQIRSRNFLSLSLFVVGLLVMVTPFENWIISRNWLTVISLQMFLYIGLERAITKSSVRNFSTLFFLPMLLLLFMHSGAWQMIFGDQ